MEDRVANRERFLEPVYLNEKMVLNCAAYIFKGYSLESETNETNQADHSRGGKAGFTFLEKLISIGIETGSKQSSTTANRSARRYTVGGLHMSLIDELRDRDMLHAIDLKSPEQGLDRTDYVETLAELRPIDVYALIDTLRMAIPIVEKVLTSIVKPLYEHDRGTQDRSPPVSKNKRANRPNLTQNKQAKRPGLDKFQLALGQIDNYATALQELLEHLEKDYRRSKQIEMVMWSADTTPKPYGVVDLDLADYEPEELRAKLSGGIYRVVGKVTRSVTEGHSINLLQKSVLFSAMSLLNRVVETHGETDALNQYHAGLSLAKELLKPFGLLEVRGPALRIAAMSVCI